ncbi:MAG: hypothetical protein SFY56_03065 [Bacteroidota bacterium]|nr:hypothetical protein [Bacteroidota bacterium]
MMIKIVKQQLKQNLKAKYNQKRILLVLSIILKINVFSQEGNNLIYLNENISNITFYRSEIIFKKNFITSDGNYILFENKTDNKIIGIGSLIKNKKQGVEVFLSNNKIKRLANYLNDTLIDYEFIYSDSNKVVEKNKYNKGILISSVKYNKYGELEYSLSQSDSFYVEKQFNYIESTTKIDTLNKNKSIFSSSIYCNEKLVLYHRNYNYPNKFKFLLKYCNGKTHILTTCLKNNLCHIGDYFEYYENGNLKVKGQFKDGKELKDTNIKIGTWYSYLENGKVKSIEKYSNDGQLVKIE